MQLKETKTFLQAVALGILSGMRTTAGPAVASHMLSRNNSGHLAKSALDFMQSDKTAIVLKVLMAGELVGDKLPATPNRTKPAGLVFRCLAGSLAGASIYKAKGNNALYGAAIGSIAALGATFGCYLLRKGIVTEFHVLDPIAGTVEDALVIGAGIALTSSM